MSNEEVTTVAADYMYLVILGEPDIISDIARAMNENAQKKLNNKLYLSSDIDTQIDYLPETDIFQRILRTNIADRREELIDLDANNTYKKTKQTKEKQEKQEKQTKVHKKQKSIEKKDT